MSDLDLVRPVLLDQIEEICRHAFATCTYAAINKNVDEYSCNLSVTYAKCTVLNIDLKSVDTMNWNGVVRYNIADPNMFMAICKDLEFGISHTVCRLSITSSSYKELVLKRKTIVKRLRAGFKKLC